MDNVVDLKKSPAYLRRQKLAMAARFRVRADRVLSRADTFLLRSMGIAARADYVGFAIGEPNTGAPEEARRYLRAYTRYDQIGRHMRAWAKRIEAEALGLVDDRANTPRGAA